MTDRTQDTPPALQEMNAMVSAAQQAYDSTVSLFNQNGKAISLPAHGKIEIDWDAKNLNVSEPAAQLWFNTPDKRLVTLETGGNDSFEIATPSGKVPHGDKHYLTFFDSKGHVEESSIAIGQIFDSTNSGTNKMNEMLWTDDKGVYHEKSLNNVNWVESEKPIKF